MDNEEIKKKVELEKDIEYLPTGAIIPNSDLRDIQVSGTFWDYCPDIIILVIGIGLAMITTGLGWAIWTYAIHGKL